MKVTVTTVKGKDLKAGELFTTASQTYWDFHATHHSIGEKVYVRTEEPLPEDQLEVDINKITIEI